MLPGPRAPIASSFVHLAAASPGLGSCWIQIRKRPHDDTRSAGHYAAGLLGIPDHMRVLQVMAVGHPAGEMNCDEVKFNQYDRPHQRPV